MDIRVPNIISSITLASDGVKAVTNGVMTGVSATQGTIFVQPYNYPTIKSANAANTLMSLTMPPNVSSITIDGVVYAVTNGATPVTVPADDATAIVSQAQMTGNWCVVTG